MRTPRLVDSQYKEVRGLSRGLDILRALNRTGGGMASTSELAQTCGIHRTTAKRLLETLRRQGFVRPGDRDGQYGLTFEVRSLSDGFQDDTWVTEVAMPLMRSAVHDLLWPVDLATIDAGFIVIRESTHRWSHLSQHRSMVGERMPMLATALGRAYLGACGENERSALLDLMRQRSDWIGDLARDDVYVKRIIRETRRRGYAFNDGEYIPDPHFAAIAVPLLSDRRLLASMNLVFPKGAVSKKDIETRYLPRLLKLSTSIGKAVSAWQSRQDHAAHPTRRTD